MFFEIPKIDNEEIINLRQSGKRGGEILTSLVKNLTFIDVFNTQIGKELLKDLIKRGNELLDIIADPDREATIGERAEYKVVRLLIQTWAKRINDYLKAVGEIKQTTTLQKTKGVTP